MDVDVLKFVGAAGLFCRMQNRLYGQCYQCEAKHDVCLLAQKLIRIGLYRSFFSINQKITKSSETNLIFLD